MRTVSVYDPALARTRTAAQHLFFAATLLIALALLVGMPVARTSGLFWAGCAAVVTATLATVTVPWRALPHLAWIAIPTVDLVAVALLRADLMPTMAALAVLAGFPALWLGADFGRTGVAVAGAGGVLVFLLPGLGPDQVVQSEADWSRLLLWELQTAGLALLAHVVVVELRRRDLLGRTILNTVAAGVLVYNADDRLLLANGQARSIAERGGYDLAHPRRPGTLVWSADRQTPVVGDEQALGRACGSERLHDTVEWLGPLHDLTAAGWHARRMHDDDGRVLGTVVVCHDLTALLSARRSQEQFLGTVSHELRTPLTSIVGYVDVAESLSSADDQLLRRSLAAIRRNSDQLATLVAQLLDETHDHPQPHQELVDLSVLLLAALERWRGACDDLGLRLVADVGDDVLADVDPHQMTRVLDALVSNATKFTPAGGDVRVRLVCDQRHVQFEVADTGIGMSSADRAYAFDRFQRGDAARVGAIQGIGLGLQTVKRLVEAHHGTVDLDSEPGLGTTVRVRVPAARTGSLAC
ncbi:HAMP domain-containing sensor histidine kinase [Nocardioides sp. CN2-186]|uniref:sensor histidine kinase n=1 Tax=Nocardioides tweenelious TaxID=3156607 RepID=UPI0032B55556